MTSAKFIYIFLLIITLTTGSCKKLVDIDPPLTMLVGENVYTTDKNAAAVLTGIYMSMNTGFSAGGESISIVGGLSADELITYPQFNAQQLITYQNNLSASGPAGVPMWPSFYSTIYAANTALEGLTASKTLTPAVKQQLMGEAHFIRALCYFYLVNFWGELPLVLSTDFKTNSTLKRSSVDIIYEQIINDLAEARNLLSDNYLASDIKTATEERTRPNKFAANALLARVYLYRKDYENAEKLSTEVINASNLYDTINVSNVFLKNNKEAIWQIQPKESGLNTFDAIAFVLKAAPNFDHSVSLSDWVLNAFENNDKRRDNWVGSITPDNITYYFPYKYKVAEYPMPLTEYTTVLRLAEQYLIRSEARARLQNFNAAQEDLNMIRKRSGLLPTLADDESSLINAILQERRIELFTEWGHRWLDLKRLNRINEVMEQITPLKGGGEWNPDKALFPIPQIEINTDKELTQNPGY
jgi:starch-binding outer membrane protein, SusD/RagB family